MALTVEHIRERIGRIEFLPTLPQTAAEVISVIEDPKSSASDLVRHMDPSLAGDVLMAANSASCGRGGRRPLGSVEQAVSAIGYPCIASIVLHMPFLSTTDGDAPFDLAAFARHSLSTAVLARTVASVFGLGEPAAAYVGGMFHDIGLLVAYQYFRQDWNEAAVLMGREGMGRLRAEAAVFGMDHAEIGAMLLESWNIAGRIVKAVRLHHRRGETEEPTEAYAVWLANDLAKTIDPGKDLGDFETFYRRAMAFLEPEAAGRIILGRDVDLFEAAYDGLKGIGSLAPTGGAE